MIKPFGPLILLFALGIALLGCNSSKNAVDEIFPLIITLEDGKGEKYLKNQYTKYNPQKVNLINKSINQFQVNFACNSKQLKELLSALKTDNNVKEYLQTDDMNADIQNGQSDKSSKVGPIRKN